MIRLSFANLSKSAFIPLYGTPVRSYLKYGKQVWSQIIWSKYQYWGYTTNNRPFVVFSRKRGYANTTFIGDQCGSLYVLIAPW